MGIFVTLFVVGLILSVIMIGLSFIGDFDAMDGDLDLDLDTDLDIDLDTDIDIDGDFDIDGAEHGVGFSFVSPFMISFLLMGIGMGGTILEENFSMEGMTLYGSAFVIGLVIMLALQKVFRTYFVKSQVNSLVRNRDFSGATGVVTLRIPKDDVGEVAVTTKMGRLKLAARSHEYIPNGTKVKVLEKVGTTLRVVPAERISGKEEPDTESNGETKARIDSTENGKDDKEGEDGKHDKEESSFTFEAYRKKDEGKKPTVIYDQRNITIKDSVISRSDFSELGSNGDKEATPSELKMKMKKEIANELFKDENDKKNKTKDSS